MGRRQEQPLHDSCGTNATRLDRGPRALLDDATPTSPLLGRGLSDNLGLGDCLGLGKRLPLRIRHFQHSKHCRGRRHCFDSRRTVVLGIRLADLLLHFLEDMRLEFGRGEVVSLLLKEGV